MHSINVTLEEEIASPVLQQTLAAWRASLVTLRNEERRQGMVLSPVTGRLLEIVGQELAQGGGVISPDDISAIEALTGITVRYRETT